MSPYRASWQAKGILLPKPKAGSTSSLGQLDPEPAPRQSQASVSRLSPSCGLTGSKVTLLLALDIILVICPRSTSSTCKPFCTMESK